MRTPIEHLRNLSAAHRKRVKAAQVIANKMKRAAEAAANAKEADSDEKE